MKCGGEGDGGGYNKQFLTCKIAFYNFGRTPANLCVFETPPREEMLAKNMFNNLPVRALLLNLNLIKNINYT